MAKYVFLYTGGQMAETPEAQAEVMQVWGAWFEALGESVLDGGNPFGASSTVTSDTTSTGGASGIGGYSFINSESLDDAAGKATGFRVFSGGGWFLVYDGV
jgi:hypothetical protein